MKKKETKISSGRILTIFASLNEKLGFCLSTHKFFFVENEKNSALKKRDQTLQGESYYIHLLNENYGSKDVFFGRQKNITVEFLFPFLYVT